MHPDKRSLLGALWSALSARFETVVPDAPATGPASVAAPLRRLVAGWQPAALPAAAALTHLPPAHLAAEPVEFSWVGETQRHIGTLVHACLARLAQEPTLPSPETIQSERAALHAQLARSGVPASEQARAAQLIVTALSQTLTDERGRWIFVPNIARRAPNWRSPESVKVGCATSSSIARSSMRAARAGWWTSRRAATRAGGLRRSSLEELARYRPQLETYRELAGALGPEPVRAALYFPLLRAFREL